MPLGLSDTDVILVPHDPSWAEEFEKEKAHLAQHILVAIDIEHCGSTSISGIPSKPIMNICMSVELLEDGADAESVRALREQFGAAGYEYKPSNFTDHQLFTKRAGPGVSTHHVHVMSRAGRNWQKAIRFRDYMRAHPEVAAEYAALKTRLAEEFPQDRRAYAEGKNPFINKILEEIL